MKLFFTISFLFMFCEITLNAQTYANLPGPENVLVVYNANSDTSRLIMEHYVQARNIPSSNIVPLQLPSREISVGDWSDPHTVKLGLNNENIQDITWAVWDSTHCVDTAKFHAWQYFIEEIANPIRLHIQQNNLISTIRYIVLCQGVPYKIQAVGDWSSPGNISIDGLLCMLNTDDYDDFVETVFNNLADDCYPNCVPPNDCYSSPFISNPYYDADPNFEMDSRFLPDYYTGTYGMIYDYKLSYLVSRLDGLSFEIIKDIIDKSVTADVTGEKTWILDGGGPGSNYITAANNKLTNLGFNTEYNSGSNNWITTSPDEVIGYTSAGVHQGMPTRYIQDTLDFTYVDGAVFNTYESYNGYSIGTLRRAGDQGLMTEFTLTGGTGGTGNSWEPLGDHIVHSDIYFSSYAIGYNQIDAAWLGMPYLAWRNVVVGDPLTRIYDCTETIVSQNTTIGSGNYTCDLVVEENATLTISSTAAVNFKRNAKLIVYGTLVLEDGVTLNFNKYSRLYLEGNLAINGNSACLNFNEVSVLKANNVSIDNSIFITFNDDSKFYINEDGTLITHPGNSFTFNNNSAFYVNGRLIVNAGNALNLNNNSKINISGKVYFNPGAVINLYNYSSLTVNGTIKSLGVPGNMIVFNYSGGVPNSQFLVNSAVDTILIDFTTFNRNGLNIGIDQIEPVKYFSITNSLFEASRNPLKIEMKRAILENSVHITNCVFNNITGTGIIISQVPELTIENNSINISEFGPEQTSIGLDLSNNGAVNIINCEIAGGTYGIRSYTSNAEDDTIEYRTDLEADISIRQCEIQSQTGILFDVNTAQTPISTLKIKDNQINECLNGIIINRFGTYMPEIKANTISGSNTGKSVNGIALTNGEEAYVYHNDILNFLAGINMNIVTTPYILENSISAIGLSVEPYSGILSVSSNGQIRKNTIRYYSYGIELGGSSSPNVGANIIADNRKYGIYISDNSNPNLSEQFVGGDQYPLSGYNTIRENGICNFDPNFTELYLNNSYINLEKGCNTIADDRGGPISCGNYLLIDGRESDKEIMATGNYWGEVNGSDPTGRFSQSLTINYEGWLTEPCTYSEGESALLLSNSKGEVYDTIYSTGKTPSELTDIETRYAAANEYYYHNQYSQAKQEYEGIIQNYGNSKESLTAYSRLFTLANLMGISSESFNQLKDLYLQKAVSQTDSLMIGTLTHLSNLCLVSAKEYFQALNNFDEQAQQNPNTDIGLYRQIDALTTSLLLPQDSTLNKGKLGKYSVNNLSDYTNKLSELLKTRGKSGLLTDKEIFPTEYSLYQNYPNPFNPVTTIKYDLPKDGLVKLEVYDILGRKVATLINETKTVGKYETVFNASALASGVYIYKLQAGDFLSSKKMILLK